MTGWIKFHRKILDNPIFLKPDLYQLFSYCLLRANHSESKIIWNGAEESLEKGCFITGRKTIAKDTGQNESAVYRRLKVLENLKMISVKSNNKYSIVKVLNYCIYQGSESETEQPTNNQRTTTEQPTNTDKNVNNVKNEKEDIPYVEIVDYLNLQTKSSYRHNGKSMRTLIHARWMDKYRLDDFKKVIDNKVASWMGTEQEKYLRPETLFGTKFDSYLNEKGASNHGASRTVDNTDRNKEILARQIEEIKRKKGMA